MTMGDRIKTRQQLLDQQPDTADVATPGVATPLGDARHDESTRPDQAPGDTVTQVAQDGADAVRQELEKLNDRMAVLKQEAADEVDRKWVSPWRTPQVFDLKVKTRLTSHPEYRSLQERVRDAKASLAEFDTATDAGNG
ncbi:MAG: hypothetical protein ACRDS0_17025 [Pseudonocardiaceae bacterium]